LKYLTFMLSSQLCGLELGAVRELLGYMPFKSSLGEHPSFVGWMTLRGKPVRVMDLRARFGLAMTRTDDTSMVIIESLGQTTALIVDSVVGLESLSSYWSIDSIKRSRIDPRYALGVASVNDQSLLLLDLPRTIIIPPPLPKAA